MSMMGAIPWYKSKIIVGAAVSILSKLLVTTGVLPDGLGGEDDAVTELIVTGVGLAADAIVIGSRVKQKQPAAIVASKAAAHTVALDNFVAQAPVESDWIIQQREADRLANEAKEEQPDLPWLSQAEAFQLEQGK